MHRILAISIVAGVHSAHGSPTPIKLPSVNPAPPASDGSKRCVMNRDCTTNPWCQDEDLESWCGGQNEYLMHCPQPHCVWDIPVVSMIENDSPPNSKLPSINSTPGSSRNCIQNKNCAQSDWCTDPNMEIFCHDQNINLKSCPSPMCIWDSPVESMLEGPPLNETKQSGGTPIPVAPDDLGDCVHNTDCSESEWCQDANIPSFCKDQNTNLKTCPSPMCKWQPKVLQLSMAEMIHLNSDNSFHTCDCVCVTKPPPTTTTRGPIECILNENCAENSMWCEDTIDRKWNRWCKNQTDIDPDYCPAPCCKWNDTDRILVAEPEPEEFVLSMAEIVHIDTDTSPVTCTCSCVTKPPYEGPPRCVLNTDCRVNPLWCEDTIHNKWTRWCMNQTNNDENYCPAPCCIWENLQRRLDEEAPATTPPANDSGDCVHNTDCSQSETCKNATMPAYCKDQGANLKTCPSPMCKWQTKLSENETNLPFLGKKFKLRGSK